MPRVACDLALVNAIRWYANSVRDPGVKSLAFALTYRAFDRTLSVKEIVEAHEKVEGRLRHVLKAQSAGKMREHS